MTGDGSRAKTAWCVKSGMWIAEWNATERLYIAKVAWVIRKLGCFTCRIPSYQSIPAVHSPPLVTRNYSTLIRALESGCVNNRCNLLREYFAYRSWRWHNIRFITTNVNNVSFLIYAVVRVEIDTNSSVLRLKQRLKNILSAIFTKNKFFGV